MIAQAYSPFWYYSGCNATYSLGNSSTVVLDDGDCGKSMSEYVDFYFGGRFKEENFWLDVGVLLAYLFAARALCYFALYKFNYTNS